MKSSLFKTVVALAFGATLAVPAAASNQSGTVTATQQTSGRFFFVLSGTRTGTVPSCSCCNSWELPTNTDGGRTMIAMLLTAQGTGKVVSIQGAGSCVSPANDREAVALGEVLN